MNKEADGLVCSLNDSCFVFASESLTRLCEMIEGETGCKPTLAALCEVLSESLRSCRSDLLQDIDVLSVKELRPAVASQRKPSPKPGDVFAVPREDGRYSFVIYITSNRFGDAFGIFNCKSVIPRLPSDCAPLPTSPAAYTGRALVIDGRWRYVDRRDDLLVLFPEAPEIFHSKPDNVSNHEIGQFGSAESPTGKLRNLTEKESSQIGLTSRTYRQVMLEEQFEEFLQSVVR